MEQQSINRHMQGRCIDCGGPRRSHGGVGRCHACDIARRAVPVRRCTGCGAALEQRNKTGLCQGCISIRARARSLDTPRAAIPSTTHAGPCAPLSLEQRQRADLLAQSVCAVYGVTWEQLRSVSKLAHHVEPRQMLMFLWTTKAHLSATQAGALLGRDHSTCLHGKDKAARMIVEHPHWASAYQQIRDHYRAARAEVLGVTPPQEKPRTLLDDYYRQRRLQHRDVVSYAS